MNHRIELTQASIPSTVQISAINENGETVPVDISGEHPLTLYVDKRELLTLMTLGAQPEALVLGWLRNQRLVNSVDDIAAIQVDWETHSVAVTSRQLKDTGVPLWDNPAHERKLEKKTTTSGCGQGTVFGDLMADLDNIQLSQAHQLSQEVLYTVMDRVRKHESIYKQAGAVHGCALCSNAGDNRGDILLFVEDVGRHNAVDAIAGLMWLHGMQGDDKIFYTTGRLTSEMVIKCAQMGIPFLVSRSGLTQMGHEIATKLGITMIGRCQGKHYLLYTGANRFITLQSSQFA
ncbi:MAG TPA: formate dehydrogenase accessory sulfurtransferase FdhD [Limnobacter sp.]|uniref:formate dehydrogenase accessory sulfurtransferase FdhD n=1 Tax=Limnobacter sp. TaxID=2003368 RepID=UPI002EDA7245